MQKIIASILILFLFGCSINANVIKDVKKIPIESGNDIEVLFCPKDRCDTALIDFLNSAKSSIHCAFFDLNLEPVLDILNKKDIDVKVVVDNENDDFEYDFIKYDTSSQYSHNKFCIIDNNKISSGSFNPTIKGAYFNNNNLIMIESKNLASQFENEFNELWNGNFGEGNTNNDPEIIYNNAKISTYFCPEDNCADRIYDEIMKSEYSIFFMTFSFTHGKIANGLILQSQKGIDVQGIFEKSQNSKYSKFNLLDTQGITVKWDENKYNMHHKVFIIDNKTVITGSFNPSNNADKRNDENIMIIHDTEIANKYIKEFKFIENPDYNNYTKKIANNIILNEVMYNPDGKDKGNEYVYLQNIGEKIINIDYWLIDNNKSNYILNGTIQTGKYLKITPDFSIKNTDGVIVLRNLNKKVVDSISFSGNKSIERIDNNFVNDYTQWISK